MAKAKILPDLLPLAEPIDSLVPLPGNPHKGKVEAIAASLNEFGMHGVIVVQRGTNFICKGNHTWRAAKKLGWDQIPVAWTDDDVVTARARALADNKTSEGSVNDRAAEAAMMAEVAAADASLLLSAGYAQDEIDALLAANASASASFEPDALTAPPEPPATPSDEGVRIKKVETRERPPEPPTREATPTFEGAPGEASLFVGHCLDVLTEMPDDSMDCVVTDPLGGMSAERPKDSDLDGNWWHKVPGPAFWNEVVRVAKPGAHVAILAGTRNSHRVACAAEDGGMEMRETLMWLFAHGMSHGIDIGQAVARKTTGDNTPWFKTLSTMSDAERAAKMADHPDNPWYGWSTELRPAWKPILVLRCPHTGSIADSVIRDGAGAINVDACRIGNEERDAIISYRDPRDQGGSDAHGYQLSKQTVTAGKTTLGRWPTDVIVDEEVAAELGPTSRYFLCAAASKSEKNDGLPEGTTNDHPTPRPVDLMAWLLRLLCPLGGTVLDPFCGSGTTGVAAVAEGMGFVGIDLNDHWINDIAAHRITAARARQEAKRAKRGPR